MRKLLFAIDNLRTGGAERLVLNQLKYLDSKVFEPWLLTILPDPPENIAEDADFLENRWVKYHPDNLLGVFVWIKILFFLRKERFDALVTNLFLSNLVVRFFAILARIPAIIAYEHNVYPDKKRWQIICDRILARFTDRIIAVSKDVLDFTARQEKITHEKFALIPNGIPVEKFENLVSGILLTKKRLGIPEGHLLVTTAGRLVPQKGHDVLIRAAGILAAKSVPFSICIFGEGRMRESLKTQIRELGLANRVFLPGNQEMRQILSETDVFALPSFREGMSLALLEAMAAEKAIVATKVSGSREVIENGVNGFLVEPGDAGGLAEKIEILLRDASLRAELGKRAKERSRDFTIQKNVESLEKLLTASFR